MHNSKEIEYLYSLSSLGWKLGLDKVQALLNEIDNPQEKYPKIHIAGTNGKGSTSAILASILKNAGYNVGLFTSPHLINVNERIKKNGADIDIDDLIYYIKLLKPLLKKYKCTFFETLVIISFLYFADQNIDIAIVEVGLGGRLDATNIIKPILTIITNIEFDHTKHLGRSRQKIAMEKGGIIKKGAICLTNSQHRKVLSVLHQMCKTRYTKLIEVPKLVKIDNLKYNDKFTSFNLQLNGTIFSELKLALLGKHQIENATLAITAANLLDGNDFKIDNNAYYNGLKNVQWPGRIQIINNSPKFIVDAAHNPDGIQKLIQTIRTQFTYDKLFVILGISKNKNYNSMIKNLGSIVDHFIIVKPDVNRILEPEILANAAVDYKKPLKIFNNVEDGINYTITKSTNNDLILGTGSHYTIGEILKIYKKA